MLLPWDNNNVFDETHLYLPSHWARVRLNTAVLDEILQYDALFILTKSNQSEISEFEIFKTNLI